MDAYNTDVRPLLAELREEMGLAPDPVRAYLASGYGEKIVVRADRRDSPPAGEPESAWRDTRQDLPVTT